MIRILHVVNDMHRAGLETMLMNYYRNIDRSKIQFDFLTHRPNKSDYDDEIISKGGKVFYAPRLYPQNYVKYFKWMKNFFNEHPEYTIIHSHIDSMSYLPLLAAKKAGIPFRIAHSHNTSIDINLKYPLKMYFKHKINSVANYRLACGEDAGHYLFKKEPFLVIPNAINSNSFYFNIEYRKKVREKLKLENSIVFGHVGRFTRQKNHFFLINIFREILKKEPNSKLLLIGEGELTNKIKKYVKTLGLDNEVLFLGKKSNVNEIYSAMDAFILPSLYEGIPVVGIEAQYSNLPCFFSDKISKEVDFNHSCFIGLNESPNKWADIILNYLGDYNREIYDIQNDKFNILKVKNQLIDFYKSLGDEQ